MCRSVPHAALPASHSAGTAGDQCLHRGGHRQLVDPRAEQGLPSPMVDYNDGRVVTSMVSSGLSLNMVFDDRDSPIYATRGTTPWAASASTPSGWGARRRMRSGWKGRKGYSRERGRRSDEATAHLTSVVGRGARPRPGRGAGRLHADQLRVSVVRGKGESRDRLHGGRRAPDRGQSHQSVHHQGLESGRHPRDLGEKPPRRVGVRRQ